MTMTIQLTDHDEARRLLAAAAGEISQRSDLLTHPVDRAVLNAVIGAGDVLLDDRRGNERLTAASGQLRHHVRAGEADPQEAALAHTLLAVLSALHPDHDRQVLEHLEAARELAEQGQGRGEVPSGGDALMRTALTGLAWALLAAGGAR